MNRKLRDLAAKELGLKTQLSLCNYRRRITKGVEVVCLRSQTLNVILRKRDSRL
jgi:hypothetical protein